MTTPYVNVILEGLGFVDGDENTAGIQEDAFIIPIDYFVPGTGLKVPTPGTTTASLVEISGNHVLNTGKAPIPVFAKFEKSGFTAPLQGENYSKIFMPALKVHMPQPNEQNAVNFSVLKNRRMVLLFKRPGGTDYIQIGGVGGFYASVKTGTVQFGDGPTGTPGVDFEIESPSIHPYYIYKGAFPAPAGS